MKNILLRISFLVSCVLLLMSVATAQGDKKPKYNRKQYLLAADENLKIGSAFTAIDLFREILNHDSADAGVMWKLAQTYLAVREYDEAAIYYLKAYKTDSLSYPKALYYAGLNAKMNGDYANAMAMLKRFAKVYNGDDATKMKKWARIDADGCNFAMKEAKPDPFVKLKHLGKEVNSNYADMAPAVRGDELYYASIHSDTVLVMKPDGSDRKKDDMLMKLYHSTKTGETYTPSAQIKTFSQAGKHISNGAFNDEGTKFFYTICDGELLTPKCDIYMSELKGTEWEPGKPLNEDINLKGFTNTQPNYTKAPNGNEVLFFVSDRDGGKGGLDIWYSVTNKKGEFTTAKNLGPKINTDRDERTPFYDTKSKTLFFSSDGWINMGGMDIFKEEGDANFRFNSTPENLGTPFNSSCNDYYYRFLKTSEEGYFVSNRPGIYSVRGKTCCDDIFAFKYDKQIYLAVKGRVIDEATNEVINGAAVNLSLRSGVQGENDVVIASDTIVSRAPYFFNLKPEKMYKVTGLKDGYFTSSQNFATTGVTKSDTQVVDIYLKKLEKNKAYRLNNIYYDFDKADLRPESKATLDTLYTILIENPTIIIELSSHTDSRGSDVYNLNLSQKRAESCVNYLINEKHIPKERIEAKGYGETKPLDDCAKYSECPQDNNGDCPCHQLNRRTEFKIIGELDGKLIYENE